MEYHLEWCVLLTKSRPCSSSADKTNITHFLFLHMKLTEGVFVESCIFTLSEQSFKSKVLHNLVLTRLIACSTISSNLAQCVFSCPPAEGWASWGRWSVCSQECGGGVQVRNRVCQPEGNVCNGTVEEGRACNPQACIGKPSCHLVIEFGALSCTWPR